MITIFKEGKKQLNFPQTSITTTTTKEDSLSLSLSLSLSQID